MRFNIATLSVATLIVTALVLQAEKARRPPPPQREPPPRAAPSVKPPSAAPVAIARTTDETPEALPAGAGRDETFYLCTACHGTAIVRQQGMTRQRWDETFDWMIEKHRMPDPGAADRGLIVDYLAASFPPRQQRGRSNPFLSQ